MESIIYSDLLNQTEFLRTMAKNNISNIGTRIMGLFDLCHLASLKLGLSMPGVFVSDTEQGFIINSICDFPLFSDGLNVRDSINEFRETGRGNDVAALKKYLDPKYENKLNVLCNVFSKYNQYKIDNNLYDIYDLMYALYDEAEKGSKTNINVSYFEDLPSSPFAISLFTKLFNLHKQNYASLFKKNIQHTNIYKCFGYNNEIAHVLNVVNEHKLPLDECLIVATNNDLAYQIINYFEYYDIPYTTSIGKPYSHNDVGKFIKRMIQMEKMSFGVDAYRELFNDQFFNSDKYLSTFAGNKYLIDDFIKQAGWLRLNCRERRDIDAHLYSKDIYESLTLLQNELNKGLFGFIKDNIVNPSSNYEALSMMESCSIICKKYGIDEYKVVDNLYANSVGCHISESGKIHITSLRGGLSSIRKYTFIIGLDSSFPGSPKENYLIFDDEFIRMGMNAFISESKIKSKEKIMNLFISCLENAYLSYSYFDNVQLKDKNPSSIISSNYNANDIIEFNYIDDKLSNNCLLIDKYNNGFASKVVFSHTPIPYDSNYLLNKKYSPSNFANFFKNPLLFALNNIYGLSIPDKDDPYQIIAPNDKGTLFHELVRNFDKNTISKKDFLSKGEKTFINFLKRRPPLITSSKDKELNSFMDVLNKYYDSECGNTPIKCEERISSKINGVCFVGAFDRLEKNKSGEYILVDYKTGSSIQHHSEDVISCIQGLIYAAMIENVYPEIKISRCEFRYPFIGNITIQIAYNDMNKLLLNEKIDEFKNAIQTGVPYAEEGDFVDKYGILVSLFKEAKRI